MHRSWRSYVGRSEHAMAALAKAKLGGLSRSKVELVDHESRLVERLQVFLDSRFVHGRQSRHHILPYGEGTRLKDRSSLYFNSFRGYSVRASQWHGARQNHTYRLHLVLAESPLARWWFGFDR